MTNRQPASSALWQGRGDHAESSNALRLFQTITLSPTFSPGMYREQIALLGFACDEGVKRNQGRTGAAGASDVPRKVLANLASYDGHSRLVDLGGIVAQTPDLEGVQQTLRNAVQHCQYRNMRTFVLGGGHKIASAHGAGVLDAFPQVKARIVNFDTRLDSCHAGQVMSDTPLRQLAQLCNEQQREFHCACIGVNRAANTQALWNKVQQSGVTMVEDLHCDTAQAQLAQFIVNPNVIYMMIDLDVLPMQEMPGVLAPAVLGVSLVMLLRLTEPLYRGSRLLAMDMVEFNPRYDDDGRVARVVARLGW